ncbi:MAG: hypothetical protein CMO40_03685 [Verrucomicrobiaceae bacterium]|nr:hypothetical protein [Verrucomicrobiaceae bacterium]
MAPSPTGNTDTKGVQDYGAAWSAIMKLARAGTSWSGRERNCAFLNCGNSAPGPRFANVSSVAGFDYPDDGRALALVDWDKDGDLDVWARNRTAPRLRLLRNNTSRASSGQGNWIGLRLEGSRSNRDAIGARVTVTLEGGTRLHETVRAGSGFLSQSTKEIHFGLGVNAAAVHSVTVRWPGGRKESFRGFLSRRHHLLVEGTGRAKPVPVRKGVREMVSTLPDLPPTAGAAQVILPGRIPLPTLDYFPSGSSADKIARLEPGSNPLLLLLFSGGCDTCREELSDLTRAAETLRAEKLDVLALSLDSITLEGDSGNLASLLVETTKFPFPTGRITARSADRIRQLAYSLFDYPPPFSVPLGLLLDSGRNIVSVYRGPVTLKTLQHDLRFTSAGFNELRDLAIPFPGRWFTKSITPSELSEFVSKYFQSTDQAECLRYLEHAANLAQLPSRADGLRQRVVAGHVALARKNSRDRKPGEAIFHFENALRLSPDLGSAHNDLGALLANEGKLDRAAIHFQRALELDPEAELAKRNLELLEKLREE